MFTRNVKGLGICGVVIALVFLAGCGEEQSRFAGAGRGGRVAIGSVEASAPASGVSESSASPGLGRACKSLADDIWSLPRLVIDDSKEIITTDNNLLWLLGAAGGSIALRQGGGDDRIADNFDDHPWISSHKEWDKFTYYAGGPGIHFAASGLWYLTAASGGDEIGKKNAWTMFEAVSVTGAATMGLKLLVNDNSPNGKSLAWPSGHTASSFAVASVLDDLYGPEVGIPAYIGAGFVGYRMMDAGDHWASDVLFGAVLGYMVGHHVASKYHDVEVAGFKPIPYSPVCDNKPAMGMGFIKEF
ncbi:MAG: phosphatase PAP2 family protein [Planctomycetes bacterium]|nr:phosphatase PAP2 family protein [Planctomycetota bacterium]